MKRNLLCGLLAAAVLSVPAGAARTVPVQVDGAKLPGTSYLESCVTYVPLRYLLDALGGWEIRWDSAQRAAVAVSGSTRLIASPAGDTIQIGEKTLRGQVSLSQGRTYVPLRIVAEALGNTVAWDHHLQGASVTTSQADHDAEDFYWLSRICLLYTSDAADD